ncbi:Glutamyl aminopeptidase, partial [Trachymyrmex cornetzi]
GMRQLFPCWDQPQLKATFNISIKHPRYYSALSNMPTKFMTYDNYTDSLRTYFYITPQMSTFQIGIVMTEYQSIRVNKNITLWCDCDSEERRPKFEFARRIMNNITLQLKSEFGGIIIPKMDHIAIPNFPQDGISKWGLIFHSEANLIYDEPLDPVIRKMEVARLIASKIAYQWFSNPSSAWWHRFWLHDALATMFGEEAVAKSFNNSEIIDLFIIQNQYESLHLDSNFNMNPVEITNSSDFNSIFGFPRYMKVIIVLRMFQNAITDEVFRNNVHVYLSKEMFSSIISYKFWSTKVELDEAYNCNLPSNEFLTWIQYKHYPVVIWEQYEHSRVIKRISKSYNTTSYGKWLIPITLREISSLNENMWKICLKPNIGSSEFPTAILNKSWMVNIEQAESTHYISLNQLNLIISLANITLTTKNAIIYVLDGYKYSKKTNILGFPLDYMLLPGLYTFKIQFFGHLRENHEDSFFKNVSKGNTVTSIISYNFWSMKDELDEPYNCNLPSNEFLTWIQYKHYPVVMWEQYKHREITKTISQSYNKTYYGEWLIPITLRELTLLFDDLKTCLKPNVNSIVYPTTVPLNELWMVNFQQAGYYRVKYDSRTLGDIVKYLNNTAGDYKIISVINRAKFIDDAFHLMINRQLDVSAFWNIAKLLSQETNFIVWYPMIKVFEYMSITIPLSREEIKFIDIMVIKLLEKPLKTLGYEEHLVENDFVKCLRQEIVKWACILQDDECEQSALRKLLQHLENPEINPLLIAPHIHERNGMRQLFPCWDNPQLKATFNISIKHPRYYSALSNMPTKYLYYTNYRDSLRTYFHNTPPMSIFQIAIVLTEYQDFRVNENITFWCKSCSEEPPLKFEFAQRIINNITLHLKSEFGGINIPKMDHIPIPNFRQDGISKWGLIFHTEANLIYDEVLDPVMRKMEVARLIAPKIAYQWFSNLLSSAWWSNFWLHDALATMFGEEAVAKSFNNSEILDLFIIQNQYESLHLDSHFNMNPVEITNLSDINSIFSFPRYMKVIIVLRMFQNAITDKVFRNNIQIYVSRHSNFMSYNFWFIKEGLDEVYYCNLPSHVFLTWIQCKHYPVVIWEQYRRSEVVKIISQSYNKTSYGVWVTPITLKEISLFYADLKTCLKPNVTSIRYPTTFPLNELWMVNFQQAGYYRAKYDSRTWDSIAKYLNETDHKIISVINRAKVIDDAFHWMMNRKLYVSAFWNLTKFLSQETNFVVWYPMIKVFEYMSIIIPFSKEEIKFIDIMVMFNKWYEEHLVENDFVKCLRQEIVKWACIFQFDECEQSALRKLQQHLGNPEKNPTFSSIISYNFWSMKEELDEAYNCNLPSNEFLTWIKYKHYPVVIWEQYVHSRVTKRISQRYNTTSYGKWLIPIDLTEISSLNENMWKICLKPNIDSSEFPIITSLNEVWMVNFQQAGYYRAKYDSVTWGIIAKHLNDTAGHYEDISVINRAKIIDDAFHLMMNRQLNVSEFWNLTQFLSQETNFLVWYPMIKVFEYTSITIPLSKVEIRFIDIMVKFRTLLEKPLKTLGYEEHLIENDFTKCLRQEIVKWACIFQYDECEQSALRKLQQHLENPEINP